MSNALPQLVANRYRLLSPLGQGGMGRVWKARDEVLHRDVAIKELVPPPSLTDEERREMRERSLREARAIARLNHINVVRIFDVLRTDGDPWIVMEYVASKSLQDTLAEDGPVSVARCIEIGLGVLGALNAAHKAGVMHRDVKPGNVLLGHDGRVVLTDFGLATIPGDPNVTRTGMVLGSPAYIAPERARDGTAGPEADLWSLGATLYAAVEGKSPYARPSAIATLAALATEPMPPPKNAGPLKPVLNGLLRKDPAERIDAEVAERMLRRAGGKRSRGIPLLDGVRRPGPNGPREPRPPVVPGPRFTGESDQRPVSPAAAAAGAAALGAAADSDATVKATTSGATGAGDDATAKVPGPGDAGSTSDAAPTAVVPADRGTDEKPPTRVAPPVQNPTAVMSAPVSPSAPMSGRAAVPPSTGTKPDNRRRNLIVGALVAVLLLAAVLIVPLLRDDPDNTGPGPQTGGTTAPESSAPTSASAPASPSTAPASPTPSPSASGGITLPAGWKMHRDQTGFAMPLPEGWRRSSDATWVKFQEPNGVGEVVIDRTDRPGSDAAEAWREIEPDRKGIVRNYQFLSIEECEGYWKTCADWEWLETRDNTRIHVRNRGFVTASNRGYAIRWEVAASEWDQKLDEFDLIAKGFKPDRQD
ncbi:Protein kinase domain-containing protein [Micromonospora pallida]|uniref:non-specific serine/threonine protein kinase n=1 Tax=Micromonospora pallida TaxID=145854 RepID=A0A1C6T368_9ACTN|nr:serine/threonine-protein kinase [Micromonospora pallida]SCL36032.1 Protein kinase domain-containing protein [Micromonospora pallida]